MPEAVEWNCRELLVYFLVCIVPGNGILERRVWCRVGHLLSVLLDEQPISTLPVVTNGQTVLEPLVLECLNPLCQKMRDGNCPAGSLCLGFFGDLLSSNNTHGLCDADSIVIKIYVRSFQSQQFTLAESAVYCQIEQHPDLFRDFFCPLVIAYGILNTCVIGSLVAFGLYLVRLFDVLQKDSCLFWGEELQLIGGTLTNRANFIMSAANSIVAYLKGLIMATISYAYIF